MLVWSWHSGAMRFSTNFQLCFAFSLAMISQGYNNLKTWSLYLFAIFVVVPFFHFWWECLAFSFSFFSFFHFDRQCLATIFSQVTANKIRKRPGAYIQRFRYGSGEKEVFSRSGWLEGWGVGISSIGPDRNQMWKCLPIFNMEIWFFGTQNTFYLIVRGLKNAWLKNIRFFYDFPISWLKQSLKKNVSSWHPRIQRFCMNRKSYIN